MGDNLFFLRYLFAGCLFFAALSIVHDVQAQTDTNSENFILFNDYNQYPDGLWLGETIRFEPETTPFGTYLRQIGNPQAGSHTLYLNSSVYFGSWEFSVIFDGFTTSNQNRIWVWLTADDNEYPHGYAVRIGESGSMKYARLFRLQGLDQPVELLRSSRVLPDDHLPFHVRVERNLDGTWRLGVKTTYDAQYQWSEVEDAEPPFFAPFFGFQTNFTSTRADRFLLGPIRIERSALDVRAVNVLSSNSIEVQLNDILPNDTNAFPDLQILNQDGHPVEISNIENCGFSVHIKLSKTLQGGNYILDTGRFQDYRTGAWIPPQQSDFTVFDIPKFGEVVINELTPRALDDYVPQFLELYNASSKIFNLAGWRIERGTQSIPLPDYVLLPGEFVVLSRSTMSVVEESQLLTLPIPVFSVSQDQLRLVGPEGTLIDHVIYSSDLTGSLVPGQSLERISPTYPGTDGVNWTPNPDVYHSAGKPNPSNQVVLPEIELLNARLTNDNVVIIDFSMITQITEHTQITINNISVNEFEWNLTNGRSIHIRSLPDTDWINNYSGTLQISHIYRYGDEEPLSFQKEIAQRVQHNGDLLVNEILYQPLQNRYSTFSDQSEYVEIYNTRPFSIDLSDVFIADTPDKYNQFRTWVPENPDLWRVDGYGYAVIHADTAMLWQESRIARFFQLEDDRHIARVNRSTLGLTSTGRGIYLRNEAIVIDSVYYSPAWHHPYIHDARGRSLERVHTGSSIASSWSTSASPLGGTPGSTNSISENPSPVGERTLTPGLHLSNNPFSPDLDGHHDMTEVIVIPPEYGYLATIHIFNRHGRLVRTLARDVYIGREHTSIWNGTDHDGRLLPTGVYIVHAELSSAEKPATSFSEVLVLARRK